MKKLSAIAGVGLLCMGSGTAIAQVAPPSPSPMHPDANIVARHDREQNAGYNHAINNMEPSTAHGAKAISVGRATAADISVGASVRDVNGQPIGKVASMDTDGVVIDTGQFKVKVPLVSFGKDKSGLLVGITAAKFNEIVTRAHAETAAAAPAKPEPHPATAADIVAGAQLRDVNGQAVGKITAVGADGATLDTGVTKIKLPLDSFGVDSSGLMIGITAQKLNEIIAQAETSAGKK